MKWLHQIVAKDSYKTLLPIVLPEDGFAKTLSNFRRFNCSSNSTFSKANFGTSALLFADPGFTSLWDVIILFASNSVSHVPGLVTTSAPASTPINELLKQFIKSYIKNCC